MRRQDRPAVRENHITTFEAQAIGWTPMAVSGGGGGPAVPGTLLATVAVAVVAITSVLLVVRQRASRIEQLARALKRDPSRWPRWWART